MSHYTDTEYKLSKSTVLNINPKAAALEEAASLLWAIQSSLIFDMFDTEGQNSGAHIKILP